nr:uncharacterized mitochondrial protein AtMg00810-like [Tanacetum cinerariifolium]
MGWNSEGFVLVIYIPVHETILILGFRRFSWPWSGYIDVRDNSSNWSRSLEYVEARLVVYQQNENVFKEDIKLLKLDVMLRDNALLDLRKKFEKAKQERDELGYDNQVFNSTVFECDDLLSSESDVSMPPSPVHDRYKSGEGYHAVPPSYTGTFMPPKPNLVLYDALNANKTIPTVSDSEDESEGDPMPTQKAPSSVQPFEHVKTPRPSVKPSMNYQPVVAGNQLNLSAGIQEHFDAGSRPTWLFDIDTLTQSMNYQPVVAGNQLNLSAGIQEYFDADPQNTDVDTTFKVKEPESEVHVSPISSAKTKKHNDKTNREAKGKSPGQNSPNSTNTFSAVGPSNSAVSPTLGKSSYVDPSQYPDDPNMPALEDITYSDDEEDVGAEAAFFNLKTNITVSPIPTTRVYKDHPVTQIIRDLSLATQTRSMTRMVKDQDGKSASTPVDTKKPLLKDPDVKRIFRYLKGKLHLGLWYPKDSPFNLVAYSDSDYARASLDRKSTIGGCQFLGCRLISWQCKKQTVVGTSSIEAEYVAAASCCAQVLWIQNQLLDYGRKVIITEDSVRQVLHLDDADSIDCLPNEEIFAELARMGYKKPSDICQIIYI